MSAKTTKIKQKFVTMIRRAGNLCLCRGRAFCLQAHEMRTLVYPAFFLLSLCLVFGVPSVAAQPRPSISMIGEPAQGEGFFSFPYVNPEAPKGGSLKLGAMGAFDNVNPFSVKGNTSGYIRGWTFENLMNRSYAEPFTLYAGISKSIETPPDRAWVEFVLDERARFSDGSQITSADVEFSWQVLREFGRPNQRRAYSKVQRVEVADKSRIRFIFVDTSDQEMPLIMGLLPVLKKGSISPEDIEKTTLTPFIGSGPYVLTEIDVPSRLVFTRNPNYWAAELPANRGHYNFDSISVDYFRDAIGLIEGFKVGQIDFRPESDPLQWENGFDFTAAKDGRVIKEEVKIGLPQGMYGYVFNTRRDKFAKKELRRAIIEAVDFEWINKSFYANAYNRVTSYFQNADLSAFDVPADKREMALLEPYIDGIEKDIVDGTFRFPKSDGSGQDRKRLVSALRWFKEAGYELESGIMRRVSDGKPLAFEVMVRSSHDEKLALALTDQMKRIGVAVNVRVVDSSQYTARLDSFDFDMIINRWYVSLSPGNEQWLYWGSASKDRSGSRNYPGIDDAGVDAMVEAMLQARTRSELISATRALDRLLMNGFYVVPLYYVSTLWLARWEHISMPETPSLYGYVIETWWNNNP